MTSEHLRNLLKIGTLNEEPIDEKEFEGLIASATDRLNDVFTGNLSYASRFDLSYNAAHALALAALRFHGYHFKAYKMKNGNGSKKMCAILLIACPLLGLIEPLAANVQNSYSISEAKIIVDEDSTKPNNRKQGEPCCFVHGERSCETM